VPDRRIHRGPDPQDAEAFGPLAVPLLREAVSDLSWLMGRGYAIDSALKLVGDRWSLSARQRLAVRRAACPDQLRLSRAERRLESADLRGRGLWIDGFNVLTTVESALGGAPILHCRDGAYRDLAGVHGNYRRVAETVPAIQRIAATLAALELREVRWLLDRPVSNSGRLAGILRDIIAEGAWPWTVELLDRPDAVLKESLECVATADSAVLDRCRSWFNLARVVIESSGVPAHVIELSA
jgi:hypothetical protein